MSLSGLDTPAIGAAYLTVLEKSGWFLLHYTSRDAIDVLKDGAKGVSEMREAAQEHCNDPGATPLFGMIHYRRRKILVKLILDGSSRLIQARAQVHWGSITSRFSDHDSTVEMTHPDQLTEDALNANTGLHSDKAPSTASTVGTKKPALGGIQESLEDQSESSRPSTAAPALPSKALEPVYDQSYLTPLAPTILRSQSLPVPTESSPPPSIAETQSLLDEDRRSTTKSLLDSIEPIDLSFLDKPKVKLAPRPATEKRVGNRMSSDGRPTAALPAGFRMTRPGTASRPQSRDSTRTISRLPPPPPIPETPMLLQRPKSSSGSVRSLPATLPKSPALSKERQRLMKFREMYKQKDANAKSKAKGKQSAVQTPAIPEEGAVSSGQPAYVVADNEELAASPDSNEAATKETEQPHDEKPEEEQSKALDPSHALQVQERADEKNAIEEEKLVTDGDQTPIAEERITEVVDNKPKTDQSTGQSLEPGDEVETPTVAEHAAGSETCSPTSILEFSGQTSTRPTSVSEVSEQIVTDTAATQSLNPVDKHEAAVNGSAAFPYESDESPPNTADVTPTAQTPKASQHEAVAPVSDPAPNFEPMQAGLNHVEVPQAYEDAAETTSDRLNLPSVDSQKRLSSTSGSSGPDDELINELRTAEVREAKPMLVSKSPIATFFPRNGGLRVLSSPFSNAASPDGSPVPKSGLSMIRLRSVSGTAAAGTTTPSPVSPTPSDGVAVTKKIEGGIAAKIADLQRSFSRAASNGATPPPTGKSVAQRASKLEPEGTPSPAHLTTPKRLSTLMGRRSATASPEAKNKLPPSPPGEGQAQPEPPVETRENLPLTPLSPKRSSKRNSFSMKSFMKPTIKVPQPPTPVDTAVFEISSAPIMIPTHQRAQSSASVRPIFHHNSRSASVSSFRSITGSRSHPGSPVPSHQEIFGSAPGSRRSIDGWRVSFGRRKSEFKSLEPGILPRTRSNSSLDTTHSADSASKERMASRTSRILKRMSSTISSLASNSRTQLQTWNERAGQGEEVEKTFVQRPLGADIGDLNVQFPDTLLWKRRWVEIDDQGYLVMKPTSGNERNGIIKRFHMNEFQPPFPPDLDRQELPNSIILDFRDGRTLQCACQSPAAQRETLNLILEYHRAWIS